eukprot:CAMPEP_0206511708 /NCGR_PEP_ID=MMETSP0324_2-20121206/60436_1 /ASSEMBLY_ACC=CAM_ASM_000836 /TAXON_ID=2866 /ORGANISM="Crypthecodinium cohnii, Strain Seligo" /LENGTH=493 /DNA_ID=CAMNT_0054003509 /DNA_START=67 /DNA_END=1548 /DNA_ORIENTATION=+
MAEEAVAGVPVEAEATPMETEKEATEKEETATEQPAAEPSESKVEEEVEVPASSVDWLAGRLPEVAKLSSATVDFIAVEGEEQPTTRKVKVSGTALQVSRAKVLLESEVSSTPSAGGASAPAAASRGGKNVAGRYFADREAIDSHVKHIQANCKDGQLLGPEDSFFLFHLTTFHPHFLEKVSAPVVGFKYGPHEDFKGTRCFFIVKADGTEEGISAKKCVEVIFPGKGQKRQREEDSSVPAAAAAAAVEQEEPPAQKPRREIQEGCIVIIEGLPDDIDYTDLKDLLADYGNPRFVEFIRAPRPAQAVQEKVAASEPAPATEEEEGSEAVAKKEGEGEQKEQKEQEQQQQQQQQQQEGESATTAEDGSSEAAKAEDSATATEEKLAGGADDAAAAGEAAEMEEEEENLKRARARFANADDAQKCVDELKEVDGCAVTVRLLTGDEEKEFWDRLWAAADAKGGKGKGKKGKGKGKDKGKKGKGKGKKGKGKHKSD